MTEQVTTFFTGYSESNREDLEDRKENLDEYAFINQEIGPISPIEHTLFVADRNRIFRVEIHDAQLPPYPSHYVIARQLNEPNLFLCGLGGSKYKKPINAIYL